MQCFVPFCENTSDNVSTSHGEGKAISFHGLPSEVHLRAAWLRALGKQDNLPDSAVVCSQHFLSDDLYETESGLWQIRTGAIPSTVQVCMICLDTDSKLLLMSKHKLDEAYEKLTRHPLCDQGNLKHTLCVQCAQRLMNFSSFRDKSLRACALMMDLVEKHELITREHIHMIDRTKHQLNSNMVLTTLGPDHCDIHIVEHPSEDNQKELEETKLEFTVKIEENDESMSVDEDMEMKIEDGNNVSHFVQDPLKCESALFQGTHCLEKYVHEHAYMQHMSMHHQNGDGECETSQVCKPHTAVSSSSAHSSLITENRQADPSPSAHSAQILVAPLLASLATNNELKVSPTEEADKYISSQYKRLTDFVAELYDNVFSKKVVPRQDGKAVKSCVNQNIASKVMSYQATSDNEVSTTEYIEPVTNTAKVIVSKTVQSKTDCLKNVIDMQCSLLSSSHTEKSGFICDICQIVFKQKSRLVKHIKTHAEVRRLTCKICQYKCKYQSDLKNHMRTHTGERPFSCKLCNHKFARNSSLVTHMRIHAGIKPFTCKLCSYKCTTNSSLVTHMRTHTGEKPYSCEICEYKCTHRRGLIIHMRTHTGIKPFSCELCNYKCTTNGGLVTHMRTHTGEKPYLCEICEYKCAHRGRLIIHMRTHTGIKPFSCELCNYKCTTKGCLVTHMRKHTGEKPYSCEICEYKCAHKENSSLVKHMRTHTGIKPFLCKLCDYKFSQSSSLVQHMRTHTGERPFSCKLCDFRCATNSTLVTHMRTHTGEKRLTCEICQYKCKYQSNLKRHMRTHTGEKRISCNLCDYKFTQNSHLVTHMRTHTGIKPYACKLCDYKCTTNSSLVRHMKTHTGEKPFSCKLCDYKCARNSHLVRHVRSHTGEKPFTCKLCNYKCTQSNNLMRHMRTHTATGENPSSCS
ncbi:zinc finger protein 271-like [Maniola hyperantus]|uniref:zinc finger protein 271-like n=1 Tax=Aphantopus hyperantus TaxID=2795564 RepID=UPI00374A7AE2